MPPPLEYLVLNAFSNGPGSGNPAAVVLLPSRPSEPWPQERELQAVATQFNLSQTAFIRGGPEGSFPIRWFSPRCEVPLCGHASLAASYALRTWGLWNPSQQPQITLQPASRPPIVCHQQQQLIHIELPAYRSEKTRPPEGLERSLGAEAKVVGAYRSAPLLLIELESAQSVRAARPNLRALQHWHRHGVALTAAGKAPFDFTTRMFAPRAGIDEDPACGSANCVLGPFWAERLGRQELRAEQASQRGGLIGVRYQAHEKEPTVVLSGAATVAMSGRLGLELSQPLASSVPSETHTNQARSQTKPAG